MLSPMLRAALAATFLATACASSRPPAARMASAQSAIRAADEVGAARSPTAALHLEYAREQYAQAEQLSRRGENDRAELILRRAEADAELSLALARETHAQADAQRVIEQARALRRENR